MKKLLYFISLLFFITSFVPMYPMATEEGFEKITRETPAQTGIGKLKLVNNSAWNVEVNYKKGPKEFTRVLRSGTEFLVGPIKEIQSLFVQTYGRWVTFGKWLGMKPLKKQINLEGIPEDQDITVYIESEAPNFQNPRGRWVISFYWFGPHGKLELPPFGNPWDAFPNVRTLGKLKIIMPRHVLAIGAGSSKSSVLNAYKELSQRWHPDKHQENPELAKKIQQIIEDAKNTALSLHDLRNTISQNEATFEELKAAFTQNYAKLSYETFKNVQATLDFIRNIKFIADWYAWLMPGIQEHGLRRWNPGLTDYLNNINKILTDNLDMIKTLAEAISTSPSTVRVPQEFAQKLQSINQQLLIAQETAKEAQE